VLLGETDDHAMADVTPRQGERGCLQGGKQGEDGH
jgi:hypothetical protein